MRTPAMTPEQIEAAKAAFLAKGGAVTQAAPAVAYGVDPAADKARRKEARAAECAEHASERRSEQVREAYHVGGRRAALEVLQGERYKDHTYE